MTPPRLHRVDLSHVDLDPRRGPVRAPLTLELLRGPSFDARFDRHTLFYDIFRSADGQSVIAIGPPVRRGLALADLEFRAAPGGPPLPFIRRPAGEDPARHAPLRLEIASPPGAAMLHIRHGSQERRAPVRPNLSAAFAGRAALVTTSRDNPIEWIEDWARFHAVACGVDAVVLYDNASLDDGPAEIEARLARVPGLREIAVIDQPAWFGIRRQDLLATDYLGMDMFLQTAMLRHALDRLLARADVMLNLDVDELLLLEDGVTARSLLSPERPVAILQRWNVFAPGPQRPGLPRHAAARRRLTSDPPPPKWALRPAGLTADIVPGIHGAQGAPQTGAAPEQAWVGHVWELTRSPKLPARLAAPEGPSGECGLLVRRLAQAFPGGSG